MLRNVINACLLLLTSHAVQAQFTADDTLRGSITAERAWWDLKFYHLRVQVDTDNKTISGSNEIRYKVLTINNKMQIDLQPPLMIEKVEQDGERLEIKKAGQNAYIVMLKKNQQPGDVNAITVWYSGSPRPAVRAPWDGGFSWSKDSDGKAFIATSCQGLGASAWWPCKDHMYDEPDSQAIDITVPAGLMDVSNGRLRKVVENADGTHTFQWFVANPINNYGVNINIADYAHFSDTLHGEKGVLSLDFYVLQKDLEKAKSQFQQAKLMLRAFEYWFGPYPFYEDGYKLVEVPYLGMEHQSSITYGNKFMNGYLGKDLSGTGWGSKWDYIIIHESGHEWFANNITYRDIADMWIHEGFTNYSESLFTEFYYGKEAGQKYVRGLRRWIENRKPIIAPYGVNAEGSGDMYYKGGNLLNMIREIIGDDVKWREILRGLNRDFYHQTVDGAQIEQYLSEKSGIPLQKVFDQYLRTTGIPTLEYELKKGRLRYHWINCVPGFNMPVKVYDKTGKGFMLQATTDWSVLKFAGKDLEVDPNFYIETRRM